MDKLWLKTPPYLPDTYGVQEMVKQCGGMGLIDDSCEYPMEPRGDWTTGRLVSSDARMGDVIHGTHKKILDTFHREIAASKPGFVLLCSGPAASMIGTDLSEAAHTIHDQSGIPAAAVEVTGHKSYDYGISRAMEALVNLLVEPPKQNHGDINILGINNIDISPANVEALHSWCESLRNTHSIKVNVWLGGSDVDTLKRAAEASLNIVVTASGIVAAKTMQKKFGVPYIAAMPSGSKLCWAIEKYLAEGVNIPDSPIAATGEPEVMIIGEQLQANAIRYALLSDYGIKNAIVLGYFLMEKELMMQGDRKIKTEDQLERAISESRCRYIIADPVIRPLIPESKKLIELPSSQYFWGNERIERPVMVGDGLDRWLKQNFSELQKG